MIHIFAPESGNTWDMWEVWTDCDDGELRDGRCIGGGKTEKEAVAAAMNDLGADLAQLRLTWEAL